MGVGVYPILLIFSSLLFFSGSALSLGRKTGFNQAPRIFHQRTRNGLLVRSERPREAVLTPNSKAASIAEATGVGFGKVFGVDDLSLAEQFLRDRRGDEKEAIEKLRAAVDWRRNFGPVPIPENIYKVEERNSGKCFVHHAADKEGRPVVVVKVRQHVVGEYPEASSQALCIATIERAINGMEDPNGELSVVFDLKGFSLKNADFGFAKFLVKALYKYYPSRLGAAYFIDAPLIFQGPWKIVKPWLRKYSRLVTFIKSNDLPGLFVDPADAPRLS